MRWHYITGVVFGVFTLTWVFSGMLSMEPFGWATNPGLRFARHDDGWSCRSLAFSGNGSGDLVAAHRRPRHQGSRIRPHSRRTVLRRSTGTGSGRRRSSAASDFTSPTTSPGGRRVSVCWSRPSRSRSATNRSASILCGAFEERCAGRARAGGSAPSRIRFLLLFTRPADTVAHPSGEVRRSRSNVGVCRSRDEPGGRTYPPPRPRRTLDVQRPA